MIEWNLAKKMTLWHYEDLIMKMFRVLSYNFVKEYYNHNMKEANMKTCFDRKGIKIGPFKSMKGLVLWAKCLPKIIES